MSDPTLKDRSYRTEEGTCLVATHISNYWPAPESFYNNIREEVGRDYYDRFLYVHHPEDFSERYREIADVSIESWDGIFVLEDIQEAEEDGAEIFREFKDFVHTGLYWESCHGSSWESVISHLYRIGEEDEYSIHFPLNYIADERELASDMLHRNNLDFVSYQIILEQGIENNKVEGFDLELEMDGQPVASWEFEFSR